MKKQHMDDQTLLFNQQAPLVHTSTLIQDGHAQFIQQGHCVLHNIENESSALEVGKRFIEQLNFESIPSFNLFKGQVKLGKHNHIPSRFCEDAVKTDFLALHFEMGLPIIPCESSSELYLLLGLYCPENDLQNNTLTRLCSFQALLEQYHPKDSSKLESNLVRYAEDYADGWPGFNSGRMSAFGKFLDAFEGTNELAYMRDYRIAEWFQADEQRQKRDGQKAEQIFFQKHGIDIQQIEETVCLKPGDLLLIDNTRVAHGRYGSRQAEELYQFHYAVEHAWQKIDALRKSYLQLS